MGDPVRLAILISGGGTTLQNLLDRIVGGRLKAKVLGVISSRANAGGVDRAEKAGVPVHIVERERRTQEMVAPAFAPPSTSYADRVWAAIRQLNPDLVCLAGWLHLLPVPDDYRLRVLNIHPSLLPSFGGRGMYGRHVHEEVLNYGAKVTGCTVHFADDTYDTGPILVQKSVPVKEGDDPDTLAARVFQAESEAYPEAIELIATGRVVVQGRRAVILD